MRDDWTEEDRAMLAKADAAYTAMTKARTKFHRCTKPEAQAAARAAYIAAEETYRKVSDERDVYFEIRKAQRMQRQNAAEGE